MNANEIIGTHDVLFITLDTLRYDVAKEALRLGKTPSLQRLLPKGTWEKRHTPSSFTYAAHHAFFAGFLPTPVSPGPHSRLFAARFPGSETTSTNTFVFDSADLVTGLATKGYHTICIGGVGFFNKRSPLGSVLPSLFHESHWNETLGVTDPASTANQVSLAIERIQQQPVEQRLFLFLNVSALHQPNCHYTPGATADSAFTQSCALAYVDQELPSLISEMQSRANLLCIISSDHGTAYGEDGYIGHRLAHSVVWDVPYAEFVLPQASTI